MVNKLLNNRFFMLITAPFIMGAITTLSFEPFNYTLINLIILPLVFYSIIYINRKSKAVYRKKPYKKNLFIFGLFFGFGFFLSGISWITNALTFDENLKSLIPLAFILIPLFLGLFMGLTIFIIGPYLYLNFSSLIIFSASLALSDYIRSNIFTGFPWNLWSYSVVWANELLQILNLIGLYSFNLLIITFYVLPIIIFFTISVAKKLFILCSATTFILSICVYGNYVINKNEEIINNSTEKIFVKVISPNFEVEYGLGINDLEERLKKLIKYSNPDKNIKTLFIWPEGVFSGYNYNEILIFQKIIQNNFSKKHFIVFGSNQLDIRTGSFYNSMLVVDNNFKIIQSYNKRKLVPFGEFLPFENLLNNFGLKKITEGYGAFLKGQTNNNLVIENISILPLICYEIIFTDLIQNSDLNSNLIINISEDGWFGDSIGPNQHFAKSIFRAIENNTFLLRSANKGISAIINNKGNIIKQLNQNEAGSIEFDITLIKSNKTKNDLIFFALLITYLLIFFIYKNKNAKK